MWAHMLEVERVGMTDEVRFSSMAEAWLGEHEEDKPSFVQTARYISQFTEFIGDTMALQVTKAQVNKWLMEPKPGRLRKDNKRGPSKVWNAAALLGGPNSLRHYHI